MVVGGVLSPMLTHHTKRKLKNLKNRVKECMAAETKQNIKMAAKRHSKTQNKQKKYCITQI